MPLQTEGVSLPADTLTKVLTISTGTEHGFADILVSNWGDVDSTVTIYISSQQTPTASDIVSPGVDIPPHSQPSAMSCMPMRGGESVWILSSQATVTARVTILGKVPLSGGN